MVKIAVVLVISLQVSFGILFQNGHQVNGKVVFTELETLNSKERDVLADFKKLVIPILPHEYMKEDIYLVKFLSFNNFKVPKAEKQLTEMLKWREDNNVDELHTNPPESFAALQKEYPIYVDGYDKKDRPICEVPFGQWSVRKAVTAGISKKLTLHIFVSCFERLMVKAQEQQVLGKNVSQAVSLINMDGFSTAEHACPSCVPILLNLAVGSEKYYPNIMNGHYLINTPTSFASLYRIIRPVLSSQTRSAVKVFSTSTEWKPFLEKRIDFKEISQGYGGAKDRSIH